MDLFSKTEIMLFKVFCFVMMIAPLFVYAGKDVTVQEPVITWNLYMTPIVVGISTGVILLFIGRLFKKQDTKDKKIETLLEKTEALKAEHLAEKEALKELHLQEWQKTTSIIQCNIKQTVDRIEEVLQTKVEKSDCEKNSEYKWDAIKDLTKRMNNAKI